MNENVSIHLSFLYDPSFTIKRKHTKRYHRVIHLKILLPHLNFFVFSYMTSNKNSIDSINDATFIYFIFLFQNIRVHTRTKNLGFFPFHNNNFHQCKVIKRTCHQFLCCLIIWFFKFKKRYLSWTSVCRD